MSEPAERTGAAQGGFGTCGQCGWRGELHACRGCLERLCLSHVGDHEAACALALDAIVRKARERVMRNVKDVYGIDPSGGRAT